jgi:DNA replication and repair protein RecF
MQVLFFHRLINIFIVKSALVMYNLNMVVKSLNIINFRNYESENISFDPGLNVLTGANASGKTNLLEAVFLSGIGKSARTNNDREMIKWDKDFLYSSLIVKKKYHTHRIEIHIDKNKSKRIVIDGMPVSKVGELMGVLNIVFFSPDELKMIKEQPKERRRFTDISLSQQKKAYYYTLVRYNRILDQRNKLLKTASVSAISEMLPVWDMQLSEAGAEIIAERMNFIGKLDKFAGESHSALTSDKEELKLIYECENIGQDRAEIKESLMKSLFSDREKDYNLKFTSAGPHRDDIKITINGTDVRKFGSQGQQRSAALSLKLAEIKHFERETGEKPVLLLDDVLSELDIDRQKKLIESTNNIQTILTCTEFEPALSPAHRIFTIDKGIINRN